MHEIFTVGVYHFLHFVQQKLNDAIVFVLFLYPPQRSKGGILDSPWSSVRPSVRRRKFVRSIIL